MNRVLMLAYFFPPSKAAGTFRTLRFVRDLPSCGWTPSVLTVQPQNYLATEQDPALLLKVPPETYVERAPAPPLHRWYKQATQEVRARLLGPRRQGARPSTPAARSGGPAPAAAGAQDPVYMLCRTPDIDAGWYAPALARGLWLVRRLRPQVIYASGGPWTTFLVARDLSRWTGVPLVLDYRDPWTNNPAVIRTGSLFEGLAQRLEASVVRRAQAIVANTDVLKETLVQAYGEALGRRTVVIHNSFDARDYESPAPPQEGVFTLSYVGALYDAHSPEPFLRGVAALVERSPQMRGRFRVRLVGPGAPRVASRVQELGIADVVQVQEPVPHAEAVRLQRSAHALLLFLTVASDHSTFVPSKLFEYVAARRPIFAVTRGGALERLLRGRALSPWVFAPEDVAGIARGLEDLIRLRAEGRLPQISEATVQSFSGEAAARALAAVLEAARTRTTALIPGSPASESEVVHA